MTNIITIQGTLQADGVTVRLANKIAVPPGRVTVCVQSATTHAETAPTMVEVLDRIHREQQTRGRKPMTEEQMAAEIAELRADDDEFEERCKFIWSQTSNSGHQDG